MDVENPVKDQQITAGFGAARGDDAFRAHIVNLPMYGRGRGARIAE